MKALNVSKIFNEFLSETNQIKRIILFTGIALVIAAASFGGYYYWDRYVHLGDQSPVEKSIRELEEAVRQHPDQVDLRLALAESYMVDKRFDDAIEQASQVLTAYPDNERAMFVAGVAYANQQNWQEAIGPLEVFAAARSQLSTAGLDRSLETALYFLGQSYIETNRCEEAIQPLTQAVQINTTDADAFYLLGVAYAETDQHDKAVTSYAEAVRFVPNYAEAYQGLVTSYTALGKADEAAYARGMVAFSITDYETARLELEKASQGLPNFAPAFIGLGLTYEELGDLQSAQAALERALEIDPDNFTASQALGRVKAKMQN
ncbi:MAG: tetratricopeptide repeat protein [Chloroflexota bacterium]